MRLLDNNQCADLTLPDFTPPPMDAGSGVKDAALWYISQGYAVVPIPPGEKGPRIKKWDELQIGPEQVDRFFQEDSNLGIITGAPSRLVCVDLDHPYAVEMAEEFLPETPAVIGREGNPRCHWFYRVEEPGETDVHKAKLNELDEKGKHKTKVLVECIANGRQVVVGPSVHPDGDRYDTLKAEPTEVDANSLRESAKALFQAVRDRLILEGLAVEETPSTVKWHGRSTTTTDGDRPGDKFNEDPQALVPLIEAHYGKALSGFCNNMKFRRNGKTHGCSATLGQGPKGKWYFYNFSGNAGLEVGAHDPFGLYTRWEHNGNWKAAAQDLASKGYAPPVGHQHQVKQIEAPVTTVNPEPQPLPPPTGQRLAKGLPEIPPEVFSDAPGFIRDFVGWGSTRSKRHEPRFILGGAIAAASVVLSQRAFSKYDVYETAPNSFVLCMGPSGSGKDTPRKLIHELFTAANTTDLLGPHKIVSWAGIVDHLIENRCVTLAMIDEIQSQIEGFRKQDGDNPLENLKLVKNLAFIPAHLESVTRTNGKKILSYPHISILGTGTSSSIADRFGAAEIGDGLLGRILYFETTQYGPENPNRGTGSPPDNLVAWVKHWQELKGPGNMKELGQEPFIRATIDEDALARFLEHSKNIEKRLNADLEKNEAAAAIWSRTAEHTNRLALIAACSDDTSESPVIRLKHVNWAIKLSNWNARYITQRFCENMAESEWGKHINRAKEILFDGMKFREFQTKMSRRVKDARQAKELLEFLQQQGIITGIEETTTSSGQKTSVIRIDPKGGE